MTARLAREYLNTSTLSPEGPNRPRSYLNPCQDRFININVNVRHHNRPDAGWELLVDDVAFVDANRWAFAWGFVFAQPSFNRLFAFRLVGVAPEGIGAALGLVVGETFKYI